MDHVDHVNHSLEDKNLAVNKMAVSEELNVFLDTVTHNPNSEEENTCSEMVHVLLAETTWFQLKMEEVAYPHLAHKLWILMVLVEFVKTTTSSMKELMNAAQELVDAEKESWDLVNAKNVPIITT